MVSRFTRSVPVTINDVLDGHVALDLQCLDRLYLHGYLAQPRSRQDSPSAAGPGSGHGGGHGDDPHAGAGPSCAQAVTYSLEPQRCRHRTANWVRLVDPVLAIACVRCFFTVPTVIVSRRAT